MAEQAFIHTVTRLSRAYLALARLSCFLLGMRHLTWRNLETQGVTTGAHVPWRSASPAPGIASVPAGDLLREYIDWLIYWFQKLKTIHCRGITSYPFPFGITGSKIKICNINNIKTNIHRRKDELSVHINTQDIPYKQLTASLTLSH